MSPHATSESGHAGQWDPNAKAALCSLNRAWNMALPLVLTCQSQQQEYLLHLLLEQPVPAGGNRLLSPVRNYNFKLHT